MGQGAAPAHGPLRGVVVMSPHWMSHGVEVMTGATPSTWHDFGGFPPALYELQYPAPARPSWRRKSWTACRPQALPPPPTRSGL